VNDIRIPEYREILKRCLDNIPDDIDKREGSIIFMALAPICYELSTMYFELNNTTMLSSFDTAVGEYLDNIVNQFGVYRKNAINAIRKIEFLDYDKLLLNVPLKSRFFDGNIFYSVIEKVSDGVFYVECESFGTMGNKFFGEVNTCQYIADLYTSTLGDVSVLGLDEESDDDLKKRFKVHINSKPFGGNIADYKNFVYNINHIKGVRIKPNFNGAGTVLVTVVGDEFKGVSSKSIGEIQEMIDPIKSTGNGIGIAPIGHRVMIRSATEILVDVMAKIVYKSGWNLDEILLYINDIIDEYLLEVREVFTDTENLVVRISQIESRILSLDGIIDINSTTINGVEENLVLESGYVPIRGDFIEIIN